MNEKIGGTIHLALGRSYPEPGGTTVSALHGDLMRDLRSAAGCRRWPDDDAGRGLRVAVEGGSGRVTGGQAYGTATVKLMSFAS